MKTIQTKWLPIVILAAISFLLPSCEGNLNDPDEYPEGVMTLKMRNSDNGGTHLYLSDNADLYIDVANNFKCSVYGGYGWGPQICDAGKKKLGAVTEIPTVGWVSQAAVIPQHTYVVKCGNGAHYYKVYVIDYIYSTYGGIIGAEVQYCQWNPGGLDSELPPPLPTDPPTPND